MDETSWHTDCTYLLVKRDSNYEIVLTFCNHKDNPEDTEGNCRTEICPMFYDLSQKNEKEEDKCF